VQKDDWKIYLGRIPHCETGTFWVSFESDPRLSRNKANIQGRCLHCIQNLHNQLRDGNSEIDMGSAYHCWKITAVLENLDRCLELLSEFEKHFPYGHVFGKLGSGRADTTTKVVVFHADDEIERDRLKDALGQCLEAMGLEVEVLISRGCAVLYEPILGKWSHWRPRTPIRFPERIPGHIERLKQILSTGKM
jgi:hypothetical protein